MSQSFDERAATWDDDPVKVERAAAVAARILERVSVGPGSRVLDFGSGTGLLGFHFLSRAASVTFADPSEGMLEQVGAKLRAGGHVNGRTLRFDSADPELPRRYDAIVSLMTLHHVPDPFATLAFLARDLEPGGWLALCDLDAEDGSFHDDPHADVHHGFDRDVLASWVERMGLEDLHACTPWVMRKQGPSGTREYPLFLLTARASGGERRGSRPPQSTS